MRWRLLQLVPQDLLQMLLVHTAVLANVVAAAVLAVI
jgi:hypothetical protein